MLEFHNRDQFDVICYDNTRKPDAASDRLRAWPTSWQRVFKVSTDAIVKQIRDDGVDVLVDLSGHTGFNLMPVFALKPAPVQLTWLYRTTTGVAAIDYHVTDSSVDPPAESNAGYIEAAMRIEPSQWCYRPSPLAAQITPLPMLTNRHVTIGSFNQFDKL